MTFAYEERRVEVLIFLIVGHVAGIRARSSPALSSNLARLSGVSLMLGGMLYSARILWEETDVVPSRPTDPADHLFFSVPLLLLIGLVGFCVRYLGRYGKLGKTGLAVSISGLVAGVAGSLAGAWVESLGLLYWLGFRFLCIGLVLLGIATIKARALPRGWNAVPLFLGLLGLGRALFVFLEIVGGATGFEASDGHGPSLGAFFPMEAGTIASVLGVLFGLGCAWLGYAVWANKT